MSLFYQIPRHSLLWLLAAQALLIIPHVQRLPIWLLVAWFVTVFWRVQIFRGIWSYPNRWVKYVTVLMCIIGLVTEYGRLIGLEPMVALLITAFVLKLLEMHKKRDVLILVYLGYFVCATEFLFSQSILMTLYTIVGIVMLTIALIGLNQTEHKHYKKRSMKLAVIMIFQSIPLMTVLFLIMPRIDSLWAVPQQAHAAKTGVSDSMSPGDFSRLAKNNETAFRVVFKDKIPSNNQLYWRGLVFSYFDGRRWTQSRPNTFSGYRLVDWSGNSELKNKNHLVKKGDSVEYEIILEPTQQHWLYGLPIADVNKKGVGITRDFRLVNQKPITTRFQYSVTSTLSFSAEINGLSKIGERSAIQLPESFNPQSIQTAKLWFEQSDKNSEKYIQKILTHFNSSFTYTLEPPLLGRDTVDDFLWKTQRGFCEHFASSFVFMMRAVGIPSRVVVGYQGGQFNSLEGFLRVSQSDAHAWSEVWLEGQGWTRVDPTAAVAPSRIESGLNAALNQNEIDLLSPAFSLQRYNYIAWVNVLMMNLEALEFKWHQIIMGYDQDNQSLLLKKLLGKITPLRIALVLLGVGGLTVLLVLFWFWCVAPKSASGLDVVLYRQFLKKLNAFGIEEIPGEGPRSLAHRTSEVNPAIASWAKQVVDEYESWIYAGDQSALNSLRKTINSSPIEKG
ncbi:MAG: transglutaminase TgpA family protein [Cellvibrionaceae bacterium]